MVSVVTGPDLRYPEGDPAFSPPHPVGEAVRRTLAQLGLDDRNPLGGWIRPGQTVFLLCNFVQHRRPAESAAQFEAKCTHGSVVRAVADLVLAAVGPSGRVLLGNAPVQSCRWDQVLSDTGTAGVLAWYRSRSAPVEALDLRLFVTDRDRLGRVTAVHRRDERDGVRFDLGGDSLLAALPHARFRVRDYDPARTDAFHGGGSHVYVLHRAVLQADAVVSIPKLKTHEKVGITAVVKGCVGAVAHKDCLAHHRFGPPRHGGDEYPSDPTGLRRAASHVHDRVQHTDPASPWGSLLRATERALARGLRTWAPHGAGAWWGNDTAWRMALDLARLVQHGRADGTVSAEPVRPHLAFLDGIVGGEGDGPLSPAPVPSRTVLFGDDPFELDAAAALAMGFEPSAVPTIRTARSTGGRWVVDGRAVPPLSLAPVLGRPFLPPRGWAGRLERTSIPA